MTTATNAANAATTTLTITITITRRTYYAYPPRLFLVEDFLLQVCCQILLQTTTNNTTNTTTTTTLTYLLSCFNYDYAFWSVTQHQSNHEQLHEVIVDCRLSIVGCMNLHTGSAYTTTTSTWSGIELAVA